MQRVGVPKSVVNGLFFTLQLAKYKVRTGYGDSETEYGSIENEAPMHGICQGNGAGPSIWAVLSSPILSMMKEKGYGLVYISPISRSKTSFSGYTFVDNTDLLQVLPLASRQMLETTMQDAVDTWEKGLKITGGAIVPDKTFWYLIDFKWVNGDWSYKTIAETPATLFVNDINDHRTWLRRVETYQAEETLGIMLAPDGNLRQQAEKLRNKSVEWAAAIKNGHLSQTEAWVALQSTLWRTLSYPLSALKSNKETMGLYNGSSNRMHSECTGNLSKFSKIPGFCANPVLGTGNYTFAHDSRNFPAHGPNYTYC